jgi:uncharacterized DUF497 family protein
MDLLAAAGIDWDEANQAKCLKHGLSVDEIEHVLMRQEAVIVPDLRNSIAEPRFIAVGKTQAGRYAFVVFTPRQSSGGLLLRPISARHMHAKEVRRYEEESARVQNR